MAGRRVLYSSPYVPAEFIAAHGLQPYRVFPARHARAFGSGANEGLCPYAKAFVEEAASDADAAVIFATTCDQMRRASEPAQAPGRPPFVFNVPATWQSATAQATYRAELERLGRFLVRLGGAAPVPGQLAATMLQYDGARASLRAARSDARALEAAEALVALYQGTEPRASASGGAAASGPRLALLGGPLFRDQFSLYDDLEAAGARIVLDATETGERTLPAAFDPAAVRADPLGELARAYFGHIPDVFRRPNDGLYAWLARELAARRVQGVLLLRCVWCDLWHAEAPRLKERLGLPVVELDPSSAVPAAPRTQARVQAMLEIFT